MSTTPRSTPLTGEQVRDQATVDDLRTLVERTDIVVTDDQRAVIGNLRNLFEMAEGDTESMPSPQNLELDNPVMPLLADIIAARTPEAPRPPERPAEHLRDLDAALGRYRNPPWRPGIDDLTAVIDAYARIPADDTENLQRYEELRNFAFQLRDLRGIIGENGRADVSRMTMGTRNDFAALYLPERNPLATRLRQEFHVDPPRQVELDGVIDAYRLAIGNARAIRGLYNTRDTLTVPQRAELRDRMADLDRQCDPIEPGDRVGILVMAYAGGPEALTRDEAQEILDAIPALLPVTPPRPPERTAHVVAAQAALDAYVAAPATWNPPDAELADVIAAFDALTPPQLAALGEERCQNFRQFAGQLEELNDLAGRPGNWEPVASLDLRQRDRLLWLLVGADNHFAGALLARMNFTGPDDVRQTELLEMQNTHTRMLATVRSICSTHSASTGRRLDRAAVLAVQAQLAEVEGVVGADYLTEAFVIATANTAGALNVTTAREVIAGVRALSAPDAPPPVPPHMTRLIVAEDAFTLLDRTFDPTEVTQIIADYARIPEADTVTRNRFEPLNTFATELRDLQAILGNDGNADITRLPIAQRARLRVILDGANTRVPRLATNFGLTPARTDEIRTVITAFERCRQDVGAIAGMTTLAAAAITPGHVAELRTRLARVQVDSGAATPAALAETFAVVLGMDRVGREEAVRILEAAQAILRRADAPRPVDPNSPAGRNARLRTFLADHGGFVSTPAEMRTVYELVGNPPVREVLAGCAPEQAAAITGIVERYAGYVTMVREFQQCAALAETRFAEAVNRARPYVRAVRARMLPDIVHAVLGGDRADSDDLAEGILQIVNRTDMEPFVQPAFADPAGLTVQQIHTIVSALDHADISSSVRVMPPAGSGVAWMNAIDARDTQIEEAVRVLEDAIATGPADLSRLDATALGRLQDAIDAVGNTDANLTFAYGAFGRSGALAPNELARLTRVRRAAPRRARPPVPVPPVPVRPVGEALPPPHEPEHGDTPRGRGRVDPPVEDGHHDTHAPVRTPRRSPEQLRDYALGLLNNAIDDDVETVPAAEIPVLEAALRPGVPGLTNGDRLALRPILERSIAARERQHHFDHHPINANREVFSDGTRALFAEFEHLDLEALCRQLQDVDRDNTLDLHAFRDAHAMVHHVLEAVAAYGTRPNLTNYQRFAAAMNHLLHFYNTYMNGPEAHGTEAHPAAGHAHGHAPKFMARVDTETEVDFMRTALALLHGITTDMRKVRTTLGRNPFKLRFKKRQASLLRAGDAGVKSSRKHMDTTSKKFVDDIEKLQKAAPMLLEGAAEVTPEKKSYLVVRALSAMWRHKVRTLLVTGVLAVGGTTTYYAVKPAKTDGTTQPKPEDAPPDVAPLDPAAGKAAVVPPVVPKTGTGPATPKTGNPDIPAPKKTPPKD